METAELTQISTYVARRAADLINAGSEPHAAVILAAKEMRDSTAALLGGMCADHRGSRELHAAIGAKIWQETRA